MKETAASQGKQTVKESSKESAVQVVKKEFPGESDDLYQKLVDFEYELIKLLLDALDYFFLKSDLCNTFLYSLEKITSVARHEV